MRGRIGPRAAMVAGAVAIVLASAPAAALEFRNAPDHQFTSQIEAALLAFRRQSARWPSGIPELQEFALRHGHPLEFSGLTGLALQPVSPQTVLVRYTTDAAREKERGFAITLVDVAGR